MAVKKWIPKELVICPLQRYFEDVRAALIKHSRAICREVDGTPDVIT